MRSKENNPKLQYIRDIFAHEDALLQEIRRKVEGMGIAGMQIGAEEGRTLQFFAQIINAKKIVEVGTLLGYSAIWMARALPEDGMLYTIESNPVHAALAKESFAKSGIGKRITLLEGEALEKLAQLEKNAPFDMIFIDADKGNYVHYLNWAEKHIRKGGVIIGDNSFLFDSVYLDEPKKGVSKSAHKAMRKFNSRLADPDKYHSIMIPTDEGMNVAVKKF